MRRLASLLFIVLLAARSVVPAGFMLQASAAGDGGLEIVICTGHGPQTITLDGDGTPSQPQPAKPDTGLCPYAASAPVALGAEVPAVIADLTRFATVPYTPVHSALRAEQLAGATSARGPPAVKA